MNERELVRRCRAGEREAQQELYDHTSERIYSLLLKMTANADDAFDLAQETYLKAFTRMGQFDGRSSITTWLYRVAINEALQFLRRAKKVRIKLQEIALQNGTKGDIERHDSIERTSARIDVNDALAALAPIERAMLLLRYKDGLDYRAIAEAVDCAPGTVASRLNRARHSLREILRKSYTGRKETDHMEHPKGGEGDSVSAPAPIIGKGKKRATRS